MMMQMTGCNRNDSSLRCRLFRPVRGTSSALYTQSVINSATQLARISSESCCEKLQIGYGGNGLNWR